MDSKVYYGEYTLDYWIRLILSKKVVLPEYQRVFVWDNKDAVSLIDSLKNNYFVPPVTIGGYRDTDGTVKNMLIDGQQRLTCILLAYLNLFPKRTGFGKSDNLFNENDDELDNEDNNILEWTFEELLKYGSTKDEILRGYNQRNYTDQHLSISKDFFKDRYLGFSYIVSYEKDVKQQTKFFSTVFRNMNITGKALYPLESRASLYFLDNTLKDWFDPECCKRITTSRKDKKSTAKYRMDFVRYVSFLSQYVNVDENVNNVGRGYARQLEKYYESYIYSVVNDDSDSMFGIFSCLFPDKEYKPYMEIFEAYIKKFKFDNMDYPSIIDLDIYFFGLIYSVFFKKKTFKDGNNDIEEMKRKLDEKILEIKQDSKHTKSPASIRYIRNRIRCSIDIYKEYFI